jgi:hypothetical protein
VGNMLQNATSRMEKDEDLQEMIWSTCSTYAHKLKMAWDVKKLRSKIHQNKSNTKVDGSIGFP